MNPEEKTPFEQHIEKVSLPEETVAILTARVHRMMKNLRPEMTISRNDIIFNVIQDYMREGHEIKNGGVLVAQIENKLAKFSQLDFLEKMPGYPIDEEIMKKASDHIQKHPGENVEQAIKNILSTDYVEVFNSETAELKFQQLKERFNF